MENLDGEARIIVESNIDIIIKEAKKSEEFHRLILMEQGIEPNLETILSYITGFLSGIVAGFYLHKYKRNMNSNEEKELLKLMKRRAWELREVFINARMETPKKS